MIFYFVSYLTHINRIIIQTNTIKIKSTSKRKENNRIDLDFEMDRIRKYAKENNISISDSYMLHATAAKINFYEEAINKMQSNPDGIPLELFTRDNVPVTVNIMSSLETTSEL